MAIDEARARKLLRMGSDKCCPGIRRQFGSDRIELCAKPRCAAARDDGAEPACLELGLEAVAKSRLRSQAIPSGPAEDRRAPRRPVSPYQSAGATAPQVGQA